MKSSPKVALATVKRFVGTRGAHGAECIAGDFSATIVDDDDPSGWTLQLQVRHGSDAGRRTVMHLDHAASVKLVRQLRESVV